MSIFFALWIFMNLHFSSYIRFAKWSCALKWKFEQYLTFRYFWASFPCTLLNSKTMLWDTAIKGSRETVRILYFHTPDSIALTTVENLAKISWNQFIYQWFALQVISTKYFSNEIRYVTSMLFSQILFESFHVKIGFIVFCGVEVAPQD